jgi:AMMECR1 domain-containing protein
MSDPRLPPVGPDDWPWLDVTVSVLSTPEPVPAADLDSLISLLRPGIDGLLITDGQRRATFLPAVWRKEPDPAGFLAALLAKGGWPAGYWAPGMAVRRYTAAEFHDPSPRTPLA